MEIPKKSPFFPTLIPENSVGEIYPISHINYGFIIQNVTSANRIIYVNSKDSADICINHKILAELVIDRIKYYVNDLNITHLLN